MNRRFLGLVIPVTFGALWLASAACSTPPRRLFDNNGGGGASGGEDLNDGGGTFEPGGGDGATTSCEHNTDDEDLDTDFDGDGYVKRDDCNECDKTVNRGAFDVPGNGVDEDCSGKVDDEVIDCDGDLPLSARDPLVGARAIGLCKTATPGGREWGVLEADWVLPDGDTLVSTNGYGALPKFGTNTPPVGGAMLAISSGEARERPGAGGLLNPLSLDKNVQHGAPPGYPKDFPGCPAGTPRSGSPHDGTALRLRIRVPSNARSLSVQQNFFTSEYSQYICTKYNDFFVIIMDPPPPKVDDGNIAFDAEGNPISVNNALLQACVPGFFTAKQFTCPLGPSSLAGTGYDSSAATGWLTTTAPVEPGSTITMLFAIWDSADGAYDSLALVDDFRFSVEGAAGPVTTPTPPR